MPAVARKKSVRLSNIHRIIGRTNTCASRTLEPLNSISHSRSTALTFYTQHTFVQAADRGDRQYTTAGGFACFNQLRAFRLSLRKTVREQAEELKQKQA